MTRHAVSFIELMVVIVIGTLILLPTIDFIVSVRRSATKGFDKLETLDSARFIMEKVQRDLRSLCSGPMNGFIPLGTDTIEFSFPTFPAHLSLNPSGELNVPVNVVSYIFDPKGRTLTRKLRYHPDLAKPGSEEGSQVIGQNVASFTICPKEILSVRFFDIELVCMPRNPKANDARIILRTAVCSDFETRLKRHPFHNPNRHSKLSFPP